MLHVQTHSCPTRSSSARTARVLFPVDVKSAVAALHSVYQGRGQVACLIVSKRDKPHRLDGHAALRAVEAGAAHIEGAAADADVQLVAIGASIGRDHV